MRLKAGRPDLARYADLFNLPAASEGSLSITFLGVASLLVDDGRSALMTDGFFSRPSLLSAGLGKIAPDERRIDETLRRAGAPRLEAVMPVHTHFDHAMDSAAVAEKTGAVLVGGASAAQIGYGRPLPTERVHIARSGEPMSLGRYQVVMIESHHCPPDRYPGSITDAVVPPVRASAYRCGEAWSILITHAPTGRSVLVMGSAGFVEGSLSGRRADIAYLGVGQLGLQDDAYIETYWNETVRTVGAERVVLIHWDDFFRPLTKPLRALPYAGDDLDNTMRVLRSLAERDGVPVHFPTVWRREDPWA